ncbi:hypothetical protein C8A03DRAFT_29468 [Achaetomium macrosporum]|uniref:Homeobox domain-containing protein n=1 Tax=Achaetomium macrosporum TaxID=79813 RepID=A0AAN7CHX9_9PEZI|nr:hypothetical protein C8A03DRAFT_29468 [Achaetomium macrosporum]
MDMDYMDPYRRRYSGLAMQPFTGQQHAHSQGPQYAYWNPLVAYYQQQHRAGAMMGQGSMHLSKPAEPKPRLAKDEVELLEREFAKNQKPSSSTKRELAEQMGVEVPRINNWFQNRRAKEKQIKKTAEFEAQQARERAASEAKSTGDQDQGATPSTASSDSNDQQYALQGLSAAAFGRDDNTRTEGDYAATKSEPASHSAATSASATPACDSSPSSSESDGFVHVKYEPSAGSAPPTQGMPELAQRSATAGSFHDVQARIEFQQRQQTVFPFRLAGATAVDCLPRPDFDALNPHHGIGINDVGAFSPFAEQDYFATPSVSQFSSEMSVASSAPTEFNDQLLRHQVSVESLAASDAVSPASMPDSPSTIANSRFKSPPPPADIAGRRKSRRPAPLGLSSLRGGPGPKTGAEVPRRADTVSPMRRISSATGLYGRVQKSQFMGPCGPRSPFTMDRNREALLQSLQETTHAPTMASLDSAMSPMSTEGMLGSSTGECVVGVNGQEDDQGYPFGSLGAVNGVPLYNAESAIKSPPGTPGVSMGFHEAYFPSSLDQTWNYVPQDEPLPTPSLCSHGGSEVEFSMAPQLPGYVASQPVTPSFPPTMGPTYTGFFGTSLGQTEYHFPESYPPESSARSSPVAPPRSKQFQFAQNVTPQDFTTDKS